MNKIAQLTKRSLFKYVGTKNYLTILKKMFLISYKSGFLKGSEEYKIHYYVKHLINKGDTVVDIGANLGYFSSIFSELVGEQGKLVSIEPVPIFYEQLKKSLKKSSNCTVYNYALGEENKKITMSIPNDNSFFRSGLASVKENASKNDFNFESTMVRGSELLCNLDKINYIKCDIEGYEKFVLPELVDLLIKHKPIVQVEIWGNHKETLLNFFANLGYERFNLLDGQLQKDIALDIDAGDYIFIFKK